MISVSDPLLLRPGGRPLDDSSAMHVVTMRASLRCRNHLNRRREEEPSVGVTESTPTRASYDLSPTTIIIAPLLYRYNHTTTPPITPIACLVDLSFKLNCWLCSQNLLAIVFFFFLSSLVSIPVLLVMSSPVHHPSSLFFLLLADRNPLSGLYF